MTTGQKIKKLREVNQLTQEQMAEKMHISPNTYGRLERGETKMTEQRLEQAAKILNVEAAQILSIPEDKIVFLASNLTLTECENSCENSQVIYYQPNYDVELKSENEKLKLALEFKDSLLAEKEKRIAILEDLVQQLKTEK